MASSQPIELFSMTLKPSYVPKTTKTLLEDLEDVADPSDKLSVLIDYISQHEEELKAIEPFKRVFPQCTLFLRDSIKTLKREYLRISDSMEAYRPEQPATTDSTGLTLMEALAIKRKEPEPEQENEAREISENSGRKGKEPVACNSADHLRFWIPNDESCKKQKASVEPHSGELDQEAFFIPSSGDGSTQLHSFQIFGDLQPSNQNITEPNTGLGSISDKEGASCYPQTFQHMPPNPYQDIQNSSQHPSSIARSNEAFVPWANLAEGSRAPVFGLAGFNNNGLNYHPKPLTQSIWKNNRLCWTQELQERFVEVLEMLGGIRDATPRDIRDGMQVEGLTTDHVKSHLQKYRLQQTDPRTENYRRGRR